MAFKLEDISAIGVGIIILTAYKISCWVYDRFNEMYKLKKDRELFRETVIHQQECIKELQRSNIAISNGIKEILKVQLKESHNEYILRESITSEEFRNYEQLYNSYHALGGNGTGTRWYEEIKTLPIID